MKKLIITNIYLMFGFAMYGTLWAKSDKGPKIIGGAEFYPTWQVKEGTLFQENHFTFGVSTNETTTFQYVQQINNQFVSENGGFDPTVMDGSFRASFKRLWVGGPSLPLTFDYQTRVYLPTNPDKRDAGLISFWRNYFEFTKVVSKTYSFRLSVVPILHLYTDDGFFKPDDKAQANPIFENRFHFTSKIILSKEVLLEIPVNYMSTRFRDFDEAAENNDNWNQLLSFDVNLYYSVNPNVTLGLSYLGGNFLNQTETGYSYGDPIPTGSLQGFLGFSF